MQPALIRDNTGWYLFIANTTSLSQLYCGNSLLNPPTGINLGDLGYATDDRGLCLLMECNHPFGLIVNHNTVHNLLLQLHFNGGPGGTKAITPLGIIANLYLPCALSEAVITSDTIYTIAVNESTLTTLFFPPCTDAPIPPDTLFDPSPIVFTIPGTYTITLIVDLGLATEQRICKEIVIDTPKPFSLGNDTTICEGTGLLLTPGSGYKHYLWNTGDTGRAILVGKTGYYSVQVTNFHDCEMEDGIYVDVLQNQSLTVDTTICWGQKYLAGGKLQSTSGTYIDTLALPYGCHKIITTNMVVRPEVVVNITGDTCLVKGNIIVLSTHVDGASDYTWQDSSHDSVFRVTVPGDYWVNVTVNKCTVSDTIQIKKCQKFTSFSLPTAFTPNDDGINDVFGPTGNKIEDFHMMIYNRWGQMLYETRNPEQGWDGKYENKYCETGIYVYVVSYRDANNPDEVTTTKGNVTLVR
jgi:gliding motility-associated-like protein